MPRYCEANGGVHPRGGTQLKSIIACAAACLAVAPAYAETPAAEIKPTIPTQLASPVTSQVAVLEVLAPQSILRAGTEVPLVTREELTTEKKQLRVGQRLQLEVASNVEMNGVVIIPAGTPVVGELTEVRNKGMWGKSGYINGRVISLRIGDRIIRLSGTFDDKGVTGTAGVVAAVAFIPVVGFFTTGTSARIAPGSAVKAFLDEDIAFRSVAAQSQVLEIPAAPSAQPAKP